MCIFDNWRILHGRTAYKSRTHKETLQQKAENRSFKTVSSSNRSHNRVLKVFFIKDPDFIVEMNISRSGTISILNVPDYIKSTLFTLLVRNTLQRDSIDFQQNS